MRFRAKLRQEILFRLICSASACLEIFMVAKSFPIKVGPSASPWTSSILQGN